MNQRRKKKTSNSAVIDNAWQRLADLTAARIGLGRAGVSVPTQPMLEFQLAHAMAQDAVHTPLNVEALRQKLIAEKWVGPIEPLVLQSEAANRQQYLQRPDWGRKLNTASMEIVRDAHAQRPHRAGASVLSLVVVDGLSARAVAEHAVPFLNCLLPRVLKTGASAKPWVLAPVCVVSQGRVAIGDPIGEGLHADCVLVLIGERPGLSSPNSMGIYLTWAPRPGCHDAQRNCISNVRPEGLNYEQAADKALYLLNHARSLGLSGVNLKDRSDEMVIDSNPRNNFLLG